MSATLSKPGIPSPMSRKEGGRAASVSSVVPGRGCSSRSRITRPFTSRTGTTARANRPSAHARAARAWLSTASASASAREKPNSVAMMSAAIPCGTK